jgi:hypothetical protein
VHFHLPKPLHGWREFVGEVAIIVLGVLIALGAEQVVETMHWRDEIAAERASLLQEASDMNSAIAARQVQQPCIDRRLGEIRTVLERHQQGEPLGLAGQISAPTGQSASRGTWQIALAGQALVHMPHDEKLAFSGVFGDFDIWDASMAKERASWVRLAILNYPELIAVEDWSGIKAAYAEAMVENEHMRLLAPWMLAEDERLLPEVKKYRSFDNLSQFRNYVSAICKPALKS